MLQTFNITNTTASGWLISKTLVKDKKAKHCILKSKEIIQLSSIDDEEMSNGLKDGTWKFIDESK